MRRKTIRNGSIILTALGIIGTIGTAVLAVNATPKAMELMKKLDDNATPKEKIATGIKPYIPAIGVGVVTIACIAGAGAINIRAQKSMFAAYGMICENFNMYRKLNIEQNGAEADDKIMGEIAQVRNCSYISGVAETPDVLCTYVEPITGIEFEAYERTVLEAEYHLNRNMCIGGYATLNDFLDLLNLPKNDPDDLGWTWNDGYVWVDFEHNVLPDGKVEINYPFEPTESYKEEWGFSA